MDKLDICIELARQIYYKKDSSAWEPLIDLLLEMDGEAPFSTTQIIFHHKECRYTNPYSCILVSVLTNYTKEALIYSYFP